MSDSRQVITTPPGVDPTPAQKQAEGLRFLERDFNQCFEQLRHYDGQIFEITKFVLASYAGLTGLSLGLYQFSLKEHIDLTLAAAAIVAIGLPHGLFLFALAVRNRVYFVKVARYVNEQRELFLGFKPFGFKNEAKMYTDPAQPRFFDWRSSQSWLMYLVGGLNAALLSLLLFLLTAEVRPRALVLPAVGLFALEVLGGVWYLHRQERTALR
jgi:hypothetical protein